jgi:hypothetical protein
MGSFLAMRTHVCVRARARESYLVKTLPTSLTNKKNLESLDFVWLCGQGWFVDEPPVTLQHPP